METNYETIIVTFKESINKLNDLFDTPETWGVSTLKEWIDCYESTRFTQIGDNTAVVTSEYNMSCVTEWLRKNTSIITQQED